MTKGPRFARALPDTAPEEIEEPCAADELRSATAPVPPPTVIKSRWMERAQDSKLDFDTSAHFSG